MLVSCFFAGFILINSAAVINCKIPIINFTGPKTKPLPNLGRLILSHNKHPSPEVQVARNRFTAAKCRGLETGISEYASVLKHFFRSSASSNQAPNVESSG